MMHQTKITREMVFRAMMARETANHVVFQRVDYADDEAWEGWRERQHDASCAQNRALAVILDTLIDECGLWEMIDH